MRGPEPGAGAVGDAGVEGQADHGNVEVRDIVQAGKSGERRQPGIPGNLHAVDLSDDAVGIAYVLLGHCCLSWRTSSHEHCQARVRVEPPLDCTI